MSQPILSPRQLRHIKKINKAQNRERKVLAEIILSEGAAQAAKTAAALAVTGAHLTEAEFQDWRRDMEQRLGQIQRHPEQNLGFIEEELARAAKEPLRLLAERAAQAKANSTRCLCPKHKIDLERQRVLSRSIDSRFGRLTVYRKYGWCDLCEAWHFPADLVLGLNKNSPA